MNDNELLEARLNYTENDKYYYYAIKNSDNEKAKKFITLLEKYQKEQNEIPLDELIWNILMETGYYYYVALMPNGKLRQANLRKLFEKSREYEKISYKGLFNFINFIEKIASKSNQNLTSARIIGENDNVVRIMSIHKSKGLEFPIVILGGTGKRFNTKDLNEKILFDQEMGIGANYVIDGFNYPLLSKQALSLKLIKDTYSEEMRILYVALTRAKDKLIIVGTEKNPNQNLSKINNSLEKYNLFEGKRGRINENLVLSLNKYISWIEAVYLFHKNDLKLKFEIVPREKLGGITIFENKQKQDLANFDGKIDKEKYEKLDKILNSKYKYEEATKLESKTSISEIKKEKTANTFDTKIKLEELKLDEKEKTLDSMEKGTLVHLVLQKLENEDYKDLIDNLNISDLEKEYLRKNYRIFENYINSELYKELKTAKEIHKESPFYMDIEKDGEKVLTQGVIDLYFIDKDENLILVDYKTDKNVDEKELHNRYDIQINLYKEALEKSLNKKVKNAYLYSTYLNKLV